MRRAAYALINLSHLKHNLATIKKIASHSKTMVVVKADAYGHGILEVCKSLTDTDAFSVSSVNEAMELRGSGISKPILALQGFFSVDELRLAVTHKIQVVIHQSEQLNILERLAPTQAMDVYIKIDTGMHRLGFEPAQLEQIVAKLTSILPPNSNLSVMTHLACADEVNNQATGHQLETFDRVLDQFQKNQINSQSIANSAGILAWPQAHRDWVRPGLMLYGVNPLNVSNESPSQVNLLPVMSFRAPLISIKSCKKGEKIGYGGDYCCPHDMVVGIVAAGYADGYPRHLANASKCSIRGELVTIIGRVSMDMITVDLSAIKAQLGEEVELWGKTISVTEIAKDAETISYELLCAAGNAVYRKYIE